MILQDRVAIVTGAGSGIGEGIALRFSQEGAKVAVVDMDRQKASETAEKIKISGKIALPLEADVSKSQDADRVVGEVKQQFGPIHILINNAGIRYASSLLEMTEEEWKRTLEVNLGGVFHFTQSVAREMIEDKIDGRIVNMSSIAAFKAVRNRAAYCTSKAAIIALTKVAALELAEYQIRVNAIAPGVIDTPLTAQHKAGMEEDSQAVRSFLSALPLGRWGQPSDVASAALFLVSDESGYITGETLTVDAGMMVT
ncbi:SDR family NAD(P)-dependent oxidoreductase [Thermodesulfobacteriota bacterium]